MSRRGARGRLAGWWRRRGARARRESAGDVELDRSRERRQRRGQCCGNLRGGLGGGFDGGLSLGDGGHGFGQRCVALLLAGGGFVEELLLRGHGGGELSGGIAGGEPGVAGHRREQQDGNDDSQLDDGADPTERGIGRHGGSLLYEDGMSLRPFGLSDGLRQRGGRAGVRVRVCFVVRGAARKASRRGVVGYFDSGTPRN